MKQTPSQTVGPFYSIGLTRRTMNVLATDATEGQRIHIEGCVLDGDGKPVPDAKVTAEYTTASDEPVLKTDSQGKLTIRIRNQGLNVVVASISEKTPGNADQDEIGRLATLAFTLGHGEE